MAKPRKFYESLNQPDWKNNGSHRRPSPKAHSDSTQQSSPSSRGTTTIHTSISQVSWRAVDFSVPIEPFQPKPIPYAGVRTGEVIGYRAWRVLEENGDVYISSLAHHRPWLHNETIYGNIDKVVDDDHWMWQMFPLIGGVYSHFTPELVVEQTKDYLEIEYPKQTYKTKHTMYELMLFGKTITETVNLLGIVFGAIECWGEVVEHELGYRAEYAKLKSLDRFHGCFDFDKLKEKYLG